MLDGVDIKNSPVTIKVEPLSIGLSTGVIVAIIAVALLVFFCTVGQMQRKLNSKRTSERIEREAELNLTVDERLAKDGPRRTSQARSTSRRPFWSTRSSTGSVTLPSPSTTSRPPRWPAISPGYWAFSSSSLFPLR